MGKYYEFVQFNHRQMLSRSLVFLCALFSLALISRGTAYAQPNFDFEYSTSTSTGFSCSGGQQTNNHVPWRVNSAPVSCAVMGQTTNGPFPTSVRWYPLSSSNIVSNDTLTRSMSCTGQAGVTATKTVQTYQYARCGNGTANSSNGPSSASCVTHCGMPYSKSGQPSSSQLCSVGSPQGLPVSSGGNWTWKCVLGSNVATCVQQDGSGTSACVSPPPPPTSPTLTFTVKETTNSSNTASNGGTITIPNNTTATLSWTSSNATSCTAVTTSPNESWNSGGVTTSSGVAVGPLATRATAYQYTLRCDGVAGTSPITQTVRVNVNAPLSSPTNFQAVCNGAGDWVTLSWNAVSGATSYALRVDDKSNSWTGTCSSVNLGDTCNDSAVTPFGRAVTPNQDYTAWVHACRPGECSSATVATPNPFKCVPAAVPSGSINATSCSIPLNGSSCTSTVSWNSSNFSGAASVNQNGSQFSSSTSNAGTSRSVNFSNNTFTLVDAGSAFTASATASVSCASGVWDGSKCAAACVPSLCESASNICQGESCNPGCSLPVVNGTKDCSKPWIEVQP